MATYKLTIEYEGTRYSGWQAQGNTTRTVQGNLIRAATEAFGEVDLGGAGRTDAGVHASGQVAHLRMRKAVDAGLIPKKINDLLPADIHVLDAVRAGDGFHARHDATSRVYLYQIATRRTAFAKPFVWWVKDRLDSRAMSNAAAHVAGRHDFSAFTDRRLAKDESRIVVVETCEIVRANDLLIVRIAASHFLWKMVRKLVACFVEVGRRNLTPDDFRLLLDPRAEPFQPTAPPSGLFLEAVLYNNDPFDRPLAPVVPVETFVSGRERA